MRKRMMTAPFFCLILLLLLLASDPIRAQGPTEAPAEPITFIEPEGAAKPLDIQFSHQRHQAFDCRECHHQYQPDPDGRYPKEAKGDYKTFPENTWQPGDPVQPCLSCHVLEKDRKIKYAMARDPNKVRSLEDAFHGKCRACHTKMKTAEDGSKLRTTCRDCHK
jgi:hypothetical protein